MSKKLKKALKGMPLHLQKVEGIKFGKTALDYLCVNIPPLCNYRCEKCFTWAGRRKLKKFIGVSKIKEIINKGKEMGVKTVAILGEGEPLLFPEIKEIVAHIHKLNIIPLIATNGSLLTKKMVDFLHIHGTSIALSLDTLDEKEYKEFCGGVADINILKNNLEYARKVFSRDIFKKNGYKVYRLAIHMTVTDKNYRNLEMIRKFCKDDIYFSCEHIAMVGVANENTDIYGGKKNLEEYKKIVRKTREIMDPMVMTQTDCGVDTCCFYYYGFAVGYEGEVMLDTHALETKGIIGNIKKDTIENLVKKSKKIKNAYYNERGGHYCIIRDPGYQNFIKFLDGKETKKIGKTRC
ncbi:MAG: radical SAM protein [Candidatus Nealsonbacteria bacterium]